MFLYNSLTQQKENFIPLENQKVKMYVCGITPYDTTHLGHAFTYTIFDILRRYLKHKDYSVQYTQNVTDIDDDILRKAKEINCHSREGGNPQITTWKELGDFWTGKFLKDLDSLNIALPDNYVKATDSISTIIIIIRGLIDKGFAYEKEGNIYFNIAKDPRYGQLSHFSQQQMILLSKERGADPNDPRKINPLDFILWQKSLPDEPYFESPFSKGRPGWHIECSAMNYKYLGPQIDIHGGGRDLIFPHHESEIAQTENFTGQKPFSKYWMHTSMLMYRGEKMSKSLGNLVMVSDLLKKYSANAIRYMFLSHHYRTPWEFQPEELEKAETAISLIKKALEGESERENNQPVGQPELKEFETSMNDDLNTPNVLTNIDSLAEKLNKKPDTEANQTLNKMVNILGFKF